MKCSTVACVHEKTHLSEAVRRSSDCSCLFQVLLPTEMPLKRFRGKHVSIKRLLGYVHTASYVSAQFQFTAQIGSFFFTIHIFVLNVANIRL